MNMPYIRYRLRVMKYDLVIGLVVATLVVLLQSSPIRVDVDRRFDRSSFQLLLGLISLAAGVAGLRAFWDDRGVSVWLQSRGMTRRQQFQSRFAAGMTIVVAIVLWMAMLMAFGVRQFVQQMAGSPWFPMIRWYELSAIPILVAAGLVVYSFTVFLIAAVKSQDSLFPGLRLVMTIIALIVVAVMAVMLATLAGPHASLVWGVTAVLCVLVSAVLWTFREQFVS